MDIINYLIKNQDLKNIIDKNQLYEKYIIEKQQPNNVILKIPYFNYTFDKFINEMNNLNLMNSKIKIKFKDKTIRLHNRKIFNDILKSYFHESIDIIIIQQSNIYYVLHCKNINTLYSSLTNSFSSFQENNLENNSTFQENNTNNLENEIEKLKKKNLLLCSQIDELKLSSQENLNNTTNKYLKIQLENENLNVEKHELKTKLHKYKSLLKQAINENKILNEQIIKLYSENKKLKNENDEFYISLINGFK